MFITLRDAFVQTVTLGAPSTGVPSTGVFSVWKFSIRHFLFHGRKEVFPISTQQYYVFQNLFIVKLFNYLIFLYFLKFIKKNFLINKAFFNKQKNI